MMKPYCSPLPVRLALGILACVLMLPASMGRAQAPMPGVGLPPKPDAPSVAMPPRAAAPPKAVAPTIHASPASPSSLEENNLSLPVVLSGGSDHNIKQWDGSGRLSGLIGTHDSAVSVLALTYVLGKTGKVTPLLISGSGDGLLKMWELAEEEGAAQMLQRSFKAHENGVTALAISPNGMIVATGGADSFIRLWERASGRLLVEVKAHDDSLRSLQFTGDGKTLVSSSDDHQIRIWKIGAQGRILDYESTIVAHDGSITQIALSPDGKLVASVSTDGYLKVWEINGGSLMQRMRVTTRSVYAVAFAPNGKTIATGDEEGKIRLWNVKTGVPFTFAGTQDRGVTALAWTSSGDMLVSGGNDKTLRYWNAVNGHQLARIAAHDGTVQTLVIVP